VTLVEFLAPLKSSTVRDKCLAVLYFLKHSEGTAEASVETVRAYLIRARVPKASKINVSQVLSRAGEYIDSPGSEKGKKIWKLTDTGDDYVRELLSLPIVPTQTQHDVETLKKLTAKIADEHVRGYVEEALVCLKFGARRATVVFLWAGAIWTLQNETLKKGGLTVTAALRKHQPKAREIKTLEDFAWINDATFLLAATDLTVVDKSQAKILGQALDLRNTSGHPTKYTLGEKKVSSFIEDLIGIVWT
jgi:hypothetical protein